ncbi:hypothetical protein N7523_001304 [Penicillium sp. IBT 18751x]|nr:hypothetical protein N7523_001304 [Penicillium sp. IBT 18751x]
MCLTDPLQSTNAEIDVGKLADPNSFTAFMSSRCRAYVVSQDEADKPQVGYHHHGCNCYSSGETEDSEGILLSAWPLVLAWLDILYKDDSYAEVVVMGTNMDEELQQAMGGLTCQTMDRAEPKIDSVRELATAKPNIQINDLKDMDLEREAKAKDVMSGTMGWKDASDMIQDSVIEAEEASAKTFISPAS